MRIIATVFRVAFLVVLLSAVSFQSSFGQTVVGIQPFGSYTTGIDKINLGSLGIHLEIPLYSRKGRSPSLDDRLALVFDSGTLSPGTYIGAGPLPGASNGGWQLVGGSPTVGGQISITTSNSEVTCNISPEINFFYQFADSSGYVHSFFPAGSILDPCVSPDPLPGTGLPIAASDGSGYTLIAADGYAASVADPSGVVTSAPGSVQDTNGNGSVNFSVNFFAFPLFSTGHYSFSGSPFLPGALPTADSTKPQSASTVVQYIDTNGQNQSITIFYGLHPLSVPSFYSESAGQTLYMYFVDSVLFPDGSAYHFSYESPADKPGQYTGRIASIQFPTGGAISYQYEDTQFPASIGTPISVLTKLTRTTSDGVTTYSNAPTSFSNRSINTSNTTISEPGRITYATFVGSNLILGAMETSRAIYSGSNTSGTALLKTVRRYNGCTGDCTSTPITGVINQISETTSYDGGPASTETTFFNAQSLPTEVDEYDFGASTPTRKIITSYAPLGNNILNRPLTVTVEDATGSPVSKITYAYDEYPVSSVPDGLPNHANVSGSRGNVTTVKRWLNTTNTTIDTHNQYDAAGQIVASSDGNGSQTQFTYDSANDQCVITTTPPTSANGASLATHQACDPNNSLPTSATDANGQVTHFYYDSMLRLHQTTYPDSGSTTVTYNDGTVLPRTVATSIALNATTNEVSTTVLDGYGRLSKLTDAGGFVTDTTYDANGNIYSTSSPYDPNSSQAHGITLFTYDPLNRSRITTNPDLSTTQLSYLGNVVNHPGNTVTRTDENGSQWVSTYDAFGRLTNVTEPNGASTTYSYNLLNDLVGVIQPGIGNGEHLHSRGFVYDSLSRLTNATNPEAGSINYTYDNNGNIHTKTDARNVVTTFSYDSQNRITSKVYSGETDSIGNPTTHPTPSVCYAYDSGFNAGSNGLGRLVGEWTQSGACDTGQDIPGTAVSWTKGIGYDPMGRLSDELQCSFGACVIPNPTHYMYDYAGNISHQSNGLANSQSPQIGFTSNYDNAGRLSKITSDWDDSTHPQTLFEADQTVNDHPPYGPFGLTAAQLGIASSSQTPSINLTQDFDQRGRITSKVVTSTGVYVPTMTVTASTSPIQIGGNEVIIIGTNCSASCGSGSIYLDGTLIKGFMVRAGGTNQLDIPTSNLTMGTHTVLVSWSQSQDSKTTTFDVEPPAIPVINPTGLQISPNPVLYNRPVTITANIGYTGGSGDGSLILDGVTEIAGFSYNPIGNPTGAISWHSPGLTATVGPHQLTLNISGDANHPPGSATINFEVKPNFTVTLGANELKKNGTVAFTISTDCASSCGSGGLSLDGAVIPGHGFSVHDGGTVFGLLQTTNFDIGAHQLTVNLSNGGGPVTQALTIDGPPLAVTQPSLDPLTVTAGQPATATAFFGYIGGPGSANWTLNGSTISGSGFQYNPAMYPDGKASIDISALHLTPGTYTLGIVLSGDLTHPPATATTSLVVH